MPRKYHTDPESVGLHRLGHAELAHNGQRCGTCLFAGALDGKVYCSQAFSMPIETYWQACTWYEPRTKDDHAHQLYRPEEK